MPVKHYILHNKWCRFGMVNTPFTPLPFQLLVLSEFRKDGSCTTTKKYGLQNWNPIESCTMSRWQSIANMKKRPVDILWPCSASMEHWRFLNATKVRFTKANLNAIDMNFLWPLSRSLINISPVRFLWYIYFTWKFFFTFDFVKILFNI